MNLEIFIFTQFAVFSCGWAQYEIFYPTQRPDHPYPKPYPPGQPHYPGYPYNSIYKRNSISQTCPSGYPDVPRPRVYWAQTDNCYWLFDQGPCQNGEWLTFDRNKQAVCTPRTCEETTLEDWNSNPSDPAKKKFWFEVEGKCYKSDSTGYCANEKEKVYLLYDNDEEMYKKECTLSLKAGRSMKNGLKTLPCKQGQKSNLGGQCRQTATFQ